MVVSLAVKGIIRPIMSVDKAKSSKEGAEVMAKNGIGCVVVSDVGKYVGIVTERVLVKRVLAVGKDPTMTTLGEIKSTLLVTIEADRSLGEATSLMLRHGIRRLIAGGGRKDDWHFLSERPIAEGG